MSAIAADSSERPRRVESGRVRCFHAQDKCRPRLGRRNMVKERLKSRTRTSRIIRARPELLYEAFVDPAALLAWLPPAPMRGELHEFDPQVGGGYRMSLFYPP